MAKTQNHTLVRLGKSLVYGIIRQMNNHKLANNNIY